MSDTWIQNDDLVDLLIKESTEGLTAEEAQKLASMTRDLSSDEREELEHVAAAAALASLGPIERMPDTTRKRVLNAIPQAAPAPSLSQADRRQSTQLAGWWVAAACFVLAVAGWWPRLIGEPTVPMAGSRPVDVSEQRQALLQRESTLQASWSAGPAAENEPILGDVVFDPVTQRGVLRFRNLPANDPGSEQYQLWIADASREYPEPVDGGVFNVANATTLPNGDLLIPFEAKLPVGAPAAFVVTAEKPGGVVVSRQEKVLALAKVEEGV